MTYDPASHPRPPNQAEHLAKVAAAVSTPVNDEPFRHAPQPSTRPDKGRDKSRVNPGDAPSPHARGIGQ